MEPTDRKFPRGPAKTKQSFQQKRRDEALRRQSDARRSRTDQARSLAYPTPISRSLGSPDTEEVYALPGAYSLRKQALTNYFRSLPCLQAGPGQAQVADAQQSQARWRRTGTRRRPNEAVRQHFADQFMHPEWLTEMPDQLAASW